MSFSSVTLPGGAQFGGTGDTFNDSSCESPTPFQNGTRQLLGVTSPTPSGGTNGDDISPTASATGAGMTSPGAANGVATTALCLSSSGGASTPGAATAATSDHSAAVSPAIAVSPPIGSAGSGNSGPSAVAPISVSAANLNFSASSLANSSVTSSSAAPSMTDPVTGQILADCDPARLAALSSYRMGAAAGGLGSMYSTQYPSTDQNPYPSISMENSFYGPLGTPGGAGAADMAAWSAATAGQLPPTAGYYGYDHPTLAAYGYGGGYDLAARRKNATRESTATLKAWLNEHKKNPYPTKGEKIMLAIITKMTLTQVSTWFANARRRLKKENKMTWEPKNKLDDEDVDVSDDDDKDKDDDKHDDHLGLHHPLHGGHLPGATTAFNRPPLSSGLSSSTKSDVDDDAKSGIPVPPSKPKIWSLADTAVCKTPPPAQQQQPQMHHQQQQQQGYSHWGHHLQQQQPQQPAGLHGHQQQQQQQQQHHLSQFRSHQSMYGGGDLSGAETPPSTPPNGAKVSQNNNAPLGGLAGMAAAGLAGLMGGSMGAMLNGGYNGLPNGYAAAAAAADAGKFGAASFAPGFKMT